MLQINLIERRLIRDFRAVCKKEGIGRAGWRSTKDDPRQDGIRPVTSPEAWPRLPEAQVEKELHKEEGMVANWRQARSKTAIGFILVVILFYGCSGEQVRSGGQPLQEVVIDEYMLTKAGFKPFKTNMETPKTQALLDALPVGQVTTFRVNGATYHAYPDKGSNILYIGDQGAYDRYVSMAQGKKVCQRVDAPDSSGFWGCFQELQQKGAR